MGKPTIPIAQFNRGRVSSKALARTDLDRVRISAEVQTNFLPRVLGSAQPRPGMEFTGSRPTGAGGQGFFATAIPMIVASDDISEIELTDSGSGSGLRVWVDDALITRPNISAPTITNGTFLTDLTGWTDNDESGAASTWATGGYMALLGTGTNRAIRDQTITITSTGSVHDFNVTIERGPVRVSIGTSAGDETYFGADLKTGTHSIAFTPTGDAYVRFSSALDYTVLVDRIAVNENTSVLLAASIVGPSLTPGQWAISNDVIFCANGETERPSRIERRDNDTWSIVNYEPEDGPFGTINISEISLTPSATSGDITLTANKSYWNTGAGLHEGELFKLVSSGQSVSANVTAENNFTGSIYVTGTGSGRTFSISITNTFVATVTLQRSTDDSTWEDVTTYTAVTATTYTDELENQLWYYRLGIKTGDFTSGQADLVLIYSGGTTTGIVKITSVTNATVANGVVLSALGSTDATLDWYRSQWSSLQGYPTAVAFHEGRLFWAGKGRIWGSVVDGYESFDDDVLGDSGPINRILDSDAFDTISWLLSLDRLMVGTPLSVLECRSTVLDEPLTPTNFNVKRIINGSVGAAAVRPVQDGGLGYFVNRSGIKVYQLENQGDRYRAQDLCALIPEIGEPYIVDMALQKNPDTTLHCVRSDGSVALLVKDDAEQVLSWIDVSLIQGNISAAYVLPGELGVLEDRVYYESDFNELVSSPATHRLKWALQSETQTGTPKLVDYFVTYNSPGTATLTGLSHLNGSTGYAWVDGVLEGPFTISSGQVVISTASATLVYVGNTFTWQWKSTKLAHGSERGTALCQPKRVGHLGVIAENIHPTAFEYGPDFTNMNALPPVENGQTISATAIRSTYDEEMFPFDGEWDTDSRVCIQSTIAKPVTLLALVFTIENNDKT